MKRRKVMAEVEAEITVEEKRYKVTYVDGSDQEFTSLIPRFDASDHAVYFWSKDGTLAGLVAPGMWRSIEVM
jgi:hypothetical protein